MCAQVKDHSGRVKLIFLALLVWMPLQYVISAKYGEPYPALVMPGFPGTLTDQNGNIRIPNVSCKISFRDGSVVWTSAHKVLSQAPSAYYDAIMRHMFSPVPNDPSAELTSNKITARLFPGRSISRYQHSRKEMDPQTKNWLRYRMDSLYPSRRPTMVEFVWYDEIFDLNQSPPKITRKPAGTRAVFLQ